MLARLVNGHKPHLPPLSSQKNEIFIFGLFSTSDDWPGWSMDSKKNEMLAFELCSLLMICLADWWTWTPSATPLLPKKWNAQFSITFNFWWSTKLINGLEPHLPPLCSQKNEMLLFWITLNFWWLAGLSDGLKPHPPPLSSQKNEILNFGLHSTFDDWPGWSMDSNPIHHPSAANKMKSSILYYVELLMINWAGWWTQTSSANPLQPIKWNAHFWILFNFWWSAKLVNGPEPHPPRLSSQKHEMLIYGFCSTSDDQPGWSMDSNPICHPSLAKKSEMLIFVLQSTSDLGQTGQWTRTPSTTHPQPIKWNAWFWIMLNFWWLAGLVDGLKPHPPPLSSQKMKCSFLDFVQLLMISQAGQWTRTPSTTPLQPKKMKCLFLDYVHFWWSAWLIDELEPHLPPLSYQKKEILIFGFCSTSDDQPDWSMDSNPIHHPSPAKKNEMLVFRLHSLLMICLADWWTWTPSATPLQPIKWNAQFSIMFNFWWSARLVDGLKPHLPPLSSQENEMLIFVLHSTSDVGQTGKWTRTLSTIPLQPKKWNAYFWITFNFWWLAGLVDGLKLHPPLVSSQKNEILIFVLPWTSDDQPGWLMDSNPICHHSPAKKNEMLIFGFCSTSDDWPSWLMDSNLIHHPSPGKKMKCSFLDCIHFWWSTGLVDEL